MSCNDTRPQLRAYLTHDEPTISAEFWDKMKWLCACMHRVTNIETDGYNADIRNILATLVQSPASLPKKGKYMVILPYMVRLSMYDESGKDSNGREIPDRVLKFQSKKGLKLQTGLYTCKLVIELSNTTWRLAQSDFIQGRGPCTVTAYLFDFCFMQVLPGERGFLNALDYSGLVDLIKEKLRSALGN